MNKTTSLESRIASMQSELNTINKELAKAPNGSLNVIKTKNGFKYYRIEAEHGTVKRSYIKKANSKLAIALAKKRYNKIRKKELEQELVSIKSQKKSTPNKSSIRIISKYKIGYLNLMCITINSLNL